MLMLMALRAARCTFWKNYQKLAYSPYLVSGDSYRY